MENMQVRSRGYTDQVDGFDMPTQPLSTYLKSDNKKSQKLRGSSPNYNVPKTP